MGGGKTLTGGQLVILKENHSIDADDQVDNRGRKHGGAAHRS